MTLSELIALRDTNPELYETIMTEVQIRADAAQKKLLARRQAPCPVAAPGGNGLDCTCPTDKTSAEQGT